MLEKRFSQTTRHSPGAMDLNQGKPHAKDAAMNAAFTLVSLFVASLAALAFTWFLPKQDFTGKMLWNAGNVIGVLFSPLIIIVSLRFGWSMGNVTVNLWESYLKRMNAWHHAEIQTYLNMQGTETTNSVSLYELDPNVPKDVLITAMLIQQQLTQGNDMRVTPWSVRGLEERLELSSGNNSILVGELQGTRPEKMSTRLAELGLITDRHVGSAGKWTPQSYDDVFYLVSKNWNRLRGITRQ
jgi:hypothetical protein